MRLLLIDHDPRYRALIRHHVTCRWTAADVVTYNPLRRGMPAPEFLAQGFDAVLLDHSSPPATGYAWLEELAARPGFAPILFLAPDDALATRERAIEAGAFDTFGRDAIDNARLLDALERAASAHLEALAAWRGSPAGIDAQQFGAARLRGYRRVRELARGSVSDLYLAESEEAGELVVLKVTRAVRKGNGVDQSFDRFLQEYEIVRRLRHPNVVRIHDLGVMDDFAFIVMEYFAGGDLRRRMRAPLTLREALGYALEIARALAAVHEAGVRHRDLKPGNVMVRDDGSLALIDFGQGAAAGKTHPPVVEGEHGVALAGQPAGEGFVEILADADGGDDEHGPQGFEHRPVEAPGQPLAVGCGEGRVARRQVGEGNGFRFHGLHLTPDRFIMRLSITTTLGPKSTWRISPSQFSTGR